MTSHAPSIEQTAALQAFANAFGRNWKGQLSDVYWYNARIWTGGPVGTNCGNILHGIRNEFGPSWLYDHCKVKPEKPAKP